MKMEVDPAPPRRGRTVVVIEEPADDGGEPDPGLAFPVAPLRARSPATAIARAAAGLAALVRGKEDSQEVRLQTALYLEGMKKLDEAFKAGL